MAKSSAGPLMYRLKVTLKHSKPPIWRRLLVDGDASLGDLHDIIQVAMGWDDDHLHFFLVGDVYYGQRDGFMALDDPEAVEEDSVRLRDVAAVEGGRFTYEYDFGDGWVHIILVEKILPRDPEQKLPVCLKGVRACPPEDIGGIWGYYDFLDALNDPQHPSHDRYMEWAKDFDPEAFDLEAVNARLSYVSQPPAPSSRRV